MPPTTATAASASRALVRQSATRRLLIRRNAPRRFQSNESTTEAAKQKAGEAASKAKSAANEAAETVTSTTKAKDAAGNVASKASQGLSKVTSSAGSAASGAASAASNAASGVASRGSRLVGAISSYAPSVVYYSKVFAELSRLVFNGQNMAPPTPPQIQAAFRNVMNYVRNPSSLASSSLSNPQTALSQARNISGKQIAGAGIVAAEILGFFCVGEMLGRLKIVGYRGGPAHAEH